ncbi:uncharacterized protein N7518_000754 [Penicillium psychrosexuale]|uniref:uncharacterized protein n=1 Tax=Penicillium psychrosexuale TaxID=1002107 RepID=UPI0025451A8B|nr:uncharacterized protein N7518_000754 [Penicillium psychrosexuale]KAJ5804451.1 hypothetical protein N7518_000754 [Penicillium psychrosexuale]
MPILQYTPPWCDWLPYVGEEDALRITKLADGISYNPMDQSAIRYLPPATHGFGIEAEGMQAIWREFAKTVDFRREVNTKY